VTGGGLTTTPRKTSEGATKKRSGGVGSGRGWGGGVMVVPHHAFRKFDSILYSVDGRPGLRLHAIY